MKTWKIYILIIFFSCLPLLNLFLSPGMPRTSDGTMHAIRFAAYYKEFISGQLPVRWVSQFHYGYGTALFNFVAPLPYIVSLPLVALGLPLTFILKVSFAFTYILAGIFMYLFALKLFRSPRGAFLVSMMYQFAPFRLVEMNTRGNLGTLYAYALVPLLFYSVIRLQEKKNYQSFILLSFTATLLCLSHTIFGFVFIGLGLLFILFRHKDRKSVFSVFISILTGIGLASFFIIPALLEQKYTNGYLFTKDLFYDHFPSLYKLIIPNFFNTVSLRVAEVAVQIGLFHLISFLFLFYVILKRKIKSDLKKIGFFILLTSILTVIFMQPVSKPLWEHVPVIRQFQFPWRFLAVIAFTTSLSVYFLFSSLKIIQNPKIYILFILLISFSTAYYWKPFQGYVPAQEKQYWEYPLTTNYNSEFNTVWMGGEPDSFPANRIEVVGGKGEITDKKLSSTKHSYTINAQNQVTIADRTYFFPGWKLSVDGKYKEIQFQDHTYQGLITFTVDPGIHTVVVQYRQSGIAQLGNLISIFILTGMILRSLLGWMRWGFINT